MTCKCRIIKAFPISPHSYDTYGVHDIHEREIMERKVDSMRAVRNWMTFSCDCGSFFDGWEKGVA